MRCRIKEVTYSRKVSQLILLTIIIIIIVAVSLLYTRKFISDRKSNEIHFVACEDGWKIALHRYLPRTDKKGLLPVILCHGLGANHFNFDIDDEHSLAMELAEDGYDVYLPDLRGNGLSRYAQWFRSGKWDIHFEDFIDQDIPAIINYITERTGNKQVHWIGHSMGGMVAYAFAQFEIAKKVRSITAVASPGHLGPIKADMVKLIKFSSILKIFPVLHQSFFARLWIPYMGLLKNDALGRTIYKRENMSSGVVRTAGVNLVSDQASTLMLQFADWVKFDDILTKDGYSYRENYDKIKSPFLFLTSQDDYFAPEECVRPVYETISSKRKKHVHFSERTGTTDYGHGDIVLGESAPLEVYPVIKQWLKELQ